MPILVRQWQMYVLVNITNAENYINIHGHCMNGAHCPAYHFSHISERYMHDHCVMSVIDEEFVFLFQQISECCSLCFHRAT